MSVRELVVLGTASQVPTRYRNHNGYLLRWDNDGLLFDPGEGTQRQMLFAQVSVSAITRILITHFHGDHCLGLPGICQRISLDRVPHPVHVHYPASGQVYYERLRHASIFHDVSHIVPCPVDAEGPIASSKTWTLETRMLDHGVPTWGYRLQEHNDRRMLPEKLKEAGISGPDVGVLKRQGQIEMEGRTVRLGDVSEEKPGQSVAFIMDTRMCDAAFELAEGVDMLICESTYLKSEQREAHDHGHLTAEQAAIIARDAGARRLVLTHFSQRYQATEDFVAEAKVLHSDVVAAKDGQRIDVPKRR